MKKKIYAISAALVFTVVANAQISAGGFPLTLQHTDGNVPVTSINFDPLTADKIENLLSKQGEVGPQMVGVNYNADIKFPESGTLTKLPNGNYVWKVQVNLNNAKGLGFVFDDFALPQGVELYIYNANHKHVIGAFNYENNDESRMFATDAVQGDVAYLELNISDESQIEQIGFSINTVAAYFQAVEHLNYFASEDLDVDFIDMYDDALKGLSSVCNINAICPQSAGFEDQRKATLQTLYNMSGGVAACSGSLVNTTSNTPADCKQYILTASHCDEGANSASSFNTLLVRFNFEQSTCAYSSTASYSTKTLTGVNMIARSYFNPAWISSPMSIKGDFLLLTPKSPVPASWGAVLSGWKRNTSTLAYTGSNKFIGFHHPGGDVKTLSTSKIIEHTTIGGTSSHWGTALNEGYAGQGSSGSSLFDNDGYVIGIASVAGEDLPGNPVPAECKVDRRGASTANVMNKVYYSKFSYSWENDGEPGVGDDGKLKPWLDPTNTGATFVEKAKSNCEPLTDTPPASLEVIEGANFHMNLFPNPSKDGFIKIAIKLQNSQDVTFGVYDITGKQVLSKDLKVSDEQILNFDLSSLPNGLYVIKMSNQFGAISQKISINK